MPGHRWMPSPPAHSLRDRCGTPRGLAGALGMRADLLQMWQHCPTKPRQVNTRRRPNKKLTTKFHFKPLNGCAQRRLRDLASLSRARKIQLLANREKIPHLMHFHERLTLLTVVPSAHP